MPAEKPEDNATPETRQERREKRRRRQQEEIAQHGKGLAQIYRNAVLKRLRQIQKKKIERKA